jgi:hypothetical protein
MEILVESAHLEQGYTEESLGRRGLLQVVACAAGWDGKSIFNQCFLQHYRSIMVKLSDSYRRQIFRRASETRDRILTR